MTPGCLPDAAAEAEYERSVTELGLRRRGGAPGGGAEPPAAGRSPRRRLNLTRH
ncbi:hypothetical protein [Streptomyces xanthophaeus]|uniref:hypothetical protein n=1 Tax=Streptomyces xanthophaeus TaxID=67385 RepID=UPI000AB6CB0D|nr:hypothetical protein [Streptomyces xanthophaeus]